MRTTILAAALLFATTGLCDAQTRTAPAHIASQPPPRSSYPDGTGNDVVGDLNASQLNQNYRGPWYVVPPNRVLPGYTPPPPVTAAPVTARSPYPMPAYAQPAPPQY